MGKYDDIINLPHPVSKKHVQMSMHDRDAQFSAFAALTGYDESINEAGRLTYERFLRSDEQKAELDKVINELKVKIKEHPEIAVSFFLPDKKKAGGSYEDKQGRLKLIDEYNFKLIFEDGEKIPLDDIYYISEIKN